MTPVISVKNLSKSFVIPHEKRTTLKEHFTGAFRKKTYETFDALHNVSFDIEKGEFIGIIGVNGSGKSTLLKILANIYTPTKGTAKINAKLSPFLELGVGFNPELSGKENVFLNATVLGLSREEIKNRYKDIVTFSELERFMDMKVKNYSSGMFVRLAFSVAIQVDADILLMDEVLAVGDTYFQEKCFNVFRKLKKQGKTIILVSHGMGSIEGFCDKVIVLDKGNVHFIGSPKRAIAAYQNIHVDHMEKVNQEVEEATKSQKIAPIEEEPVETLISDSIKKDKQQKWGSGDMIFEDVWLEDKSGKKKHVFTDEAMSLHFKVTAKRDIKTFSVGCVLKDVAGLNVYELNTLLSEDKLPALKAGETCHISLKIPDIFNHGHYTFTVALGNKDASDIYEWIDHALQFEIIKKRRNHAVTNVTNHFTIIK